jgi:uncharacterized protein YaiL (DUF2058 family)
MNDTLKDQLIALGLAQEKNEKAQTRRAGSRPARRERKGAKDGGEMSLGQAYRLREQEEQEAVAAGRRKKREEDLLRRRTNARIQEIVDAHGLNDERAELKRNFLYKGRIRSVLVTPEQLRALNAGELGVVFLRGNYILMRPEQVAEVRRISADHVPDLGGTSDSDEAEFPVPDDLVW